LASHLNRKRQTEGYIPVKRSQENPTLGLKERLHTHLGQLVRDRDPYLASAGHFYVQQYIRQQLEQWGTVEIHEFQVRGKIHQNLILNLPPLSQEGKGGLPPILIGAHYDAVPGTPGADDNATGVAALLELARAFAAEPLNYPVRIVAFDMEEYGMLGSSQYAADLQQQQQPLRLMLSLEMLGYCDSAPGSQRYPAGLQYFYPNRGNFIALVGNLSTIPDLIHLSRTIRKAGTPSEWLPVPVRGLIVPQTRLSDHSPFWDRGYRAMMVTDTAFMRNPHYHKRSDRIETLNLDFLSGICQGLEIGIRHL
jgi:Zn-dependent M28 family amino/carboxypeptidase